MTVLADLPRASSSSLASTNEMWLVGSSSRSSSGRLRHQHGQGQPTLLADAEHTDGAAQLAAMKQCQVPERDRRPGQVVVHLARGQVRTAESNVLRQQPDPPRRDVDSSRVDGHAAGDDTEQRRLAGPVRSGDQQLLARRRLQPVNAEPAVHPDVSQHHRRRPVPVSGQRPGERQLARRLRNRGAFDDL